MNLSVVIIAKNEAEMIGGCIESLVNLDPKEVIVIDDCSTDDTASIAQHKGAKVKSHRMKDFGEQREFAADKTNSEWILYVDADERISKELAEEIKQLFTTGELEQYSTYILRRINYYLGKKWPKEEHIARLFRKQDLKGWKGEVHESAIFEGKAKVLHNELLHFTHRNLKEMVENTISWSDYEAKLRFEAHHPSIVPRRVFRVMFTAFVDYYIKQGGWKVGTVGLIESIYQAFSMFVTYAKLWELQQVSEVKIK